MLFSYIYTYIRIYI